MTRWDRGLEVPPPEPQPVNGEAWGIKPVYPPLVSGPSVVDGEPKKPPSYWAGQVLAVVVVAVVVAVVAAPLVWLLRHAWAWALS